MSSVERHLHLVRTPPARGEGKPRLHGDVGLLVMLFAIAAVPLASTLAGVGEWEGGSLGVSALGVVLVGRELLASLPARRPRRRNP